jgi:hypothetical protein
MSVPNAGISVLPYSATCLVRLYDSPYQVRLRLVLPKSIREAMDGITFSAGSFMLSWIAFTTT